MIVVLAFNLRPAITALPPVLPDLGITKPAQSVLVALPVLCFGLAAFAGPTLRRRMGEEKGLFLALLVLAAGMLLRAVWAGAVGLFAGTLVVGISIAMLNVQLPSLIRRRFPTRLGPLTAAYTTALSAGAAIAAAATVPVMRLGGSIAFALAFWAVPVVIAAALWVPMLRTGEAPAKSEVRPADAARVWRSPLAWQVTLFFGLQSLVYFALVSWMPAIYRDRGLDASTGGVLLGVLSAIGVLGNLAAPLLAARFGDDRKVVAAGVLLTGSGLLALLLGPVWLAVAAVVGLGLGLGACFSLALYLIPARSGDSAIAARLSSMAQGVGYLMGAVGLVGVGLLHSVSGSWAIAILALIGFVTLQGLAGLQAGRHRMLGA